MRLVFDTNVVVSGILWRGPPHELMIAARFDRLKLFTSFPMLLELADVLGRRKFSQRILASGIPIEDRVAGYAALTTIVIPAEIFGVAPDPDDDVVIGTAVAAAGDLIVTGTSPCCPSNDIGA